MTTNYPTSLDNFTNPTASDNLNTPTVLHSDQHSNLNDAVEALQVKVGIDNSAAATSLDYRINALEDAKLSTTLADTKIFVGNGSNVATAVSMSGDATIANTGALTLATVNADVGLFGNNTESPIVVLDAKGRVTAASQITITPAATSITGGAALTKVDDTNVTLTLGGSSTNALLKATSITVGWSGQLGVTRGGTGLSSTTANQLLYSSSNNVIAGLATANNSIVATNGSGVPALTATLPTAVQDNITRLGTIASGAVPASLVTSGAALTKTDDTNVTLTLGGTPASALLKGTSLTLGWTGTLAASRLNSNVVQAITNDTNVTGSISSQNLTLGWTGTLAQSRGGTGVNSWQPWYDLRQASSNLILWLEASDPSNDGTEVAGTYQTWVNKTGSTLDPTQGTAANRPTLVLAAQNDLPCMRFDGTNDTYSIADNSAFDCTNGFICIIACKLRVNGNYVLMEKRDSGAASGWQISAITGAGASTGLQFLDAGGAVYTLGGITAGQAEIYTWQMTSTIGQMWINGVNFYSTSGDHTPTDIPNSDIYIGSYRAASNFFDGDLYAIALFNASTPLQTIRYVEAMFKQKYGTV